MPKLILTLLALIAALQLAVTTPVVFAKTHNVHWQFNTHPSKIRIPRGDKVRLFWSGQLHSVSIFHNQADYASCSLSAQTTNVVSPRISGSVVISGKKLGVGKHYFACKVAYPSHCLSGVKIEIDVCKKKC